MDIELIATIGTGVIFILGIFLKWRNTKALLKEVALCLTTISEAVEDNDVTGTEAKAIVASFEKVIAKAKAVLL